MYSKQGRSEEAPKVPKAKPSSGKLTTKQILQEMTVPLSPELSPIYISANTEPKERHERETKTSEKRREKTQSSEDSSSRISTKRLRESDSSDTRDKRREPRESSSEERPRKSSRRRLSKSDSFEQTAERRLETPDKSSRNSSPRDRSRSRSERDRDSKYEKDRSRESKSQRSDSRRNDGKRTRDTTPEKSKKDRHEQSSSTKRRVSRDRESDRDGKADDKEREKSKRSLRDSDHKSREAKKELKEEKKPKESEKKYKNSDKTSDETKPKERESKNTEKKQKETESQRDRTKDKISPKEKKENEKEEDQKEPEKETKMKSEENHKKDKAESGHQERSFSRLHAEAKRLKHVADNTWQQDPILASRCYVHAGLKFLESAAVLEDNHDVDGAHSIYQNTGKFFQELIRKFSIHHQESHKQHFKQIIGLSYQCRGTCYARVALMMKAEKLKQLKSTCESLLSSNNNTPNGQIGEVTPVSDGNTPDSNQNGATGSSNIKDTSQKKQNSPLGDLMCILNSFEAFSKAEQHGKKFFQIFSFTSDIRKKMDES